MPELHQIAVAAAGMLLASTVSSTLGFGIGLTAGPVLLLALEPQSSVVLINTAGLLPVSLVLYQTWGRLKLREIAPLAAAGVLGAPVGAYVLGAVDPVAMRLVITFLVLALAVVVTTGAGASLPRPRWLGPPLALVVSALITSSGVGGPLMALFLLEQDRDRDEFRGTLAAYFLVVMAVGSAGYAATGLLTGERLLLRAGRHRPGPGGLPRVGPAAAQDEPGDLPQGGPGAHSRRQHCRPAARAGVGLVANRIPPDEALAQPSLVRK